MALESPEVRVFGTGNIYVAPVGTSFPATVSAAVDPDAGWVDLGYTTEEGARFQFSREVNRIPAWQSFDPIRMVVTGVPKQVMFDLQQWNQNTLKLALGGGTVTEPSAGEYQYEPPSEEFVDERALIVEGRDGDYTYRFCYRRAFNEQPVDFAMVRETSSPLPIGMSILAADNGLKPFLIQTDDPNVGEILEAAS